MIQSNYFDCDSCGQQAKLFHGLCPECLPKYEADPTNKQGEPGERPGIYSPIAESTRKLATHVAEMKACGGSIEEWARRLANDISKGTD